MGRAVLQKACLKTGLSCHKSSSFGHSPELLRSLALRGLAGLIACRVSVFVQQPCSGRARTSFRLSHPHDVSRFPACPLLVARRFTTMAKHPSMNAARGSWMFVGRLLPCVCLQAAGAAASIVSSRVCVFSLLHHAITPTITGLHHARSWRFAVHGFDPTACASAQSNSCCWPEPGCRCMCVCKTLRGRAEAVTVSAFATGPHVNPGGSLHDQPAVPDQGREAAWLDSRENTPFLAWRPASSFTSSSSLLPLRRVVACPCDCSCTKGLLVCAHTPQQVTVACGFSCSACCGCGFTRPDVRVYVCEPSRCVFVFLLLVPLWLVLEPCRQRLQQQGCIDPGGAVSSSSYQHPRQCAGLPASQPHRRVVAELFHTLCCWVCSSPPLCAQQDPSTHSSATLCQGPHVFSWLWQLMQAQCMHVQHSSSWQSLILGGCGTDSVLLSYSLLVWGLGDREGEGAMIIGHRNCRSAGGFFTSGGGRVLSVCLVVCYLTKRPLHLKGVVIWSHAS